MTFFYINTLMFKLGFCFRFVPYCPHFVFDFDSLQKVWSDSFDNLWGSVSVVRWGGFFPLIGSIAEGGCYMCLVIFRY
jgi:hypothetical protein